METVMRGRRQLSEDNVIRIVHLLSSPEMDIPSIAQRMRCSRTTVAQINRKCDIRYYGGKPNEMDTRHDAYFRPKD